MESSEIVTKLDNSSVDFDCDLQKVFDPQDEDDEFVRLTRMELDMADDEPEYSVSESSTDIAWKIELDVNKNYAQLITPVAIRARGYVKVEKISGPEDDWTEEYIEKEWETDSSWTVEVKSWGTGDLDSEIAPNYVSIDLERKKVYIDF